MGEQFENAVSMKELTRSIRECKRGVSHKDGPIDWYTHNLMKAGGLRRDILKGRYKLRPGTPVKIFRPKRRVAIAPWFRDRAWQRSMCNNGVYDDLTRSLCYDNVACQKGKGTDLAMRRAIRSLQRIYSENGKNDGWGVHLDVKKYFPNTPHEIVKQQDHNVLTDKLFYPYLAEIVDSVKDERSADEIAADPFGERGTGLGSQINQLNQVALLNDIDHRLKCFCKHSQRYMDDFLVVDKDRRICERARAIVAEMLREKGLQCVDKSGVFRLGDGFYYLRHYFKLTETGKVIIRLHPDSMKLERAALRSLKRDVDAGRLTMDKVRQHYQCWIAQAEYSSGDGCIRNMDKYYTKLFREKPKYKRKRRYLHGNYQNVARADAGGTEKA